VKDLKLLLSYVIYLLELCEAWSLQKQRTRNAYWSYDGEKGHFGFSSVHVHRIRVIPYLLLDPLSR